MRMKRKPFLTLGCTFNLRIRVFDAHGHTKLSLSQWPLGSCLKFKEYDSLRVNFRSEHFIIGT